MERLRAAGVRVAHVEPSTINVAAREWLAAHPEIIERARTGLAERGAYRSEA